MQSKRPADCLLKWNCWAVMWWRIPAKHTSRNNSAVSNDKLRSEQPKRKKGSRLPCFYQIYCSERTNASGWAAIYPCAWSLHHTTRQMRFSSAHYGGFTSRALQAHLFSSLSAPPRSLPLWMTCEESNLIKPVSKGETVSLLSVFICAGHALD